MNPLEVRAVWVEALGRIYAGALAMDVPAAPSVTPLGENCGGLTLSVLPLRGCSPRLV